MISRAEYSLRVENTLKNFLFKGVQVAFAAAGPNDVAKLFGGMSAAVLLSAQAN